MPFGSIPVDSTTELIFLALFVVAVCFCILEMFVVLIAKGRLGRMFPRKILTFVMMPSGVYKILETVAEKDTLETTDHEFIFHSRNKTIYKPQKGGGPQIAIVDPISESAQNVRLTHYILANQEGENLEEIKFNSKDEAFLYYYENIFLPDYKGANPQWIDDEKEKVKAAKGIIQRKTRQPVSTSTETQNADGSVTHTDESKVVLLPTRPMTSMEYDDLIATIRERLTESGVSVFPVTVDGDVVDLNRIAAWMGTPAPENTLKGEFERGRDFERRNGQKQAMVIMIYVVAVVALLMGGVIAYKLLG